MAQAKLNKTLWGIVASILAAAAAEWAAHLNGAK